MVLSFGSMGDDIDDLLAGADSTALVTQHTPESTVPLAMVGPTTSVPTGSLSSGSSSGGWSGFLSSLGLALAGTTANVTAQALSGKKTPAQLAALQAQQAQAAAAQKTQLLLILGGVVLVVGVGALLLRRRSA